MNLLNNTVAIVENNSVIRSKYGEWSFGCFFSKFYNSIKFNRQLFFINDFRQFKISFLDNINSIYSDFTKIFSKFNVNLNLNHIYF